MNGKTKKYKEFTQEKCRRLRMKIMANVKAI